MSAGTRLPKSVFKVPTKPVQTHVTDNLSVNVCIRPVGCCRSVYFFSPTLTPEEMEGLGTRISILRNNDGLNSILQSFCHKSLLKDSQILPRTAYAMTDKGILNEFQEDETFPPTDTPVFCGASHPVLDGDVAAQGYETLAKGIRGTKTSKIPNVFVLNGTVTDGGYALALSSHVLCTSQAAYRIDNPLKGLSYDPIGLSYTLTHMRGSESQRISHPLARILSFTGYELDNYDLIATDLGTHLIDPPEDGRSMIDSLEYNLADLMPWDQQDLIRPPIRLFGREVFDEDLNVHYRNRAVKNLLDEVASGTSLRNDWWSRLECPPSEDVWEEDFKYGEEYSSEFVDVGTAFADVFHPDKEIHEIMEHLTQIIKAGGKKEEDDVLMQQYARNFLDEIRRRSPLALVCMDRLLKKGMQSSFEDALAMEQRVWKKLLTVSDYRNWVQDGMKEDKPMQWKHKSCKDVTSDEIAEILEEG